MNTQLCAQGGNQTYDLSFIHQGLYNHRPKRAVKINIVMFILSSVKRALRILIIILNPTSSQNQEIKNQIYK